MGGRAGSGGRSTAPGLAGACALVVLALAAAACSNSAEIEGEAPQAVLEDPSTVTPAPAGTSASAHTQRAAVSGDAVAVVTRWADEVARALTDGDTELSSASDTMTEAGRTALAGVLAEQYSGDTFPGPFPFEVMGQTSEGKTTVVETCLVNTGWATEADGSADLTSTVPIAFLVEPTAAGLAVAGTRAGSAHCTNVNPEEHRW